MPQTAGLDADGSTNSPARVRCTTAMKHMLQTNVQHEAEAFHDKVTPLSGVL